MRDVKDKYTRAWVCRRSNEEKWNEKNRRRAQDNQNWPGYEKKQVQRYFSLFRDGVFGTIAVVLAFVGQVDVFGNLHWVRSPWFDSRSTRRAQGESFLAVAEYVGAYTSRNGPQNSQDALLGIAALSPIFLLGARPPPTCLQVTVG